MHFLKKVLHAFDEVILLTAQEKTDFTKIEKLVIIDKIIKELKETRQKVCDCKKSV